MVLLLVPGVFQMLTFQVHAPDFTPKIKAKPCSFIILEIFLLVAQALDRVELRGAGGRNGAEEGRSDSGFKFPELVGRPDEEKIDGPDAPAHLVRSLQLDERVSDDDTDGVRCAHDGERREGQRKRAREAEYDGRDAKHDHCGKHPASHCLLRRMPAQVHGHDEGPDGWGGPEGAKPPGAGVEDVAREDGKERRGAPKTEPTPPRLVSRPVVA